ncbi:MAG: F0F1 ATP synthase subunit B [Eubacteriales bacterium]|nr:F0F1 ATP synthase subunit B [Eubacteriales bacterium]
MDVQGLVGIVPWNFVAQICNLFIQVYLIKRFLFKPINQMLEKRKAMADAEIQDAIQAKDEAIAMKTEYEQNMLEAKNKANEILVTAQKTASVQSEEILKEASQQAAAMKAKAENDIAQEKRKAVNEIKDEIGGMAIEIAGKVVEREISEEDHTKLIDEFIANVGEAS